MHKTLLIVMASTMLACHSSQNSTMSSTASPSTQNDTGWISLFDGKTTNGWHTYGKTTIGKAWKVADNVLYLDAASKKDWQTAEGGDIVTDQEFDNFHLKLEWKISPKGNSGIIFYIKEDAAHEYPWQTGPEMQILDNGPTKGAGHADAEIKTHRAGDLYDLITSKEVVKPAGEWNEVEIIANNGKLEFYMNGQQTLSTTMWDDNWKRMIAKSKFKNMPDFGTIRKGRIALQDHGDNVWFRNIRIKHL
jgi:hypothetical protein